MTPQRIINKIKDNTPLKTIKETQKETRKTMVTLIVSSFGLVTALAWNDAIQSFFNLVFPKSGGLVGKFIYAIFITIIVVNLSSHLKTFFDPEEPDKQKKPQQ
jgi:polyferredoxin